MVNQRDGQVCVAREFESDFETGESWGYNRFFKNELLEEEGYLIPEDDQLLFKFYIRPPTYFQITYFSSLSWASTSTGILN